MVLEADLEVCSKKMSSVAAIKKIQRKQEKRRGLLQQSNQQSN